MKDIHNVYKLPKVLVSDRIHKNEPTNNGMILYILFISSYHEYRSFGATFIMENNKRMPKVMYYGTFNAICSIIIIQMYDNVHQ